MTDPDLYGGGETLANIHRLMASHRAAYAPPLAEFKVTLDQLKAIRRSVPIVSGQPVAGQSASALFGIPVILVDTEEESTLFTMTWESLVRRMGGRP